MGLPFRLQYETFLRKCQVRVFIILSIEVGVVYEFILSYPATCATQLCGESAIKIVQETIIVFFKIVIEFRIVSQLLIYVLQFYVFVIY